MAKNKTESTAELPKATRIENINPHDVLIQDGVARTGRYDVPEEEKVVNMAISILKDGQLTPIRVRESGGKYDPIFGRTRSEACRMIRDGFASGDPAKPTQHAPKPDFTVKAEIIACTDEEAYRQAKIENFQRADLTIADIVANVTEMVDVKGLKPKEIVEITGVNRSNITRYVKIGKYEHSELLLEALHNDSIGMMTAYDITQEEFSAEELTSLLNRVSESNEKATPNEDGVERKCTQASVQTYLAQRKAAAKLDGSAATEPAVSTDDDDKVVPAETTAKKAGVTKAGIIEQLQIYADKPVNECTLAEAHIRKFAVAMLSYIGGGSEEKPYTSKELHASVERTIKALDKQLVK